MFNIFEAAQGILHIQDALGVSFSFLQGRSGGLLIDTGYGLENVRSLIDGLSETPYHVLLTHGHHDHILGAADFENVFLCAEDLEEYRLRSGYEQRKKIADRAVQSGIAVPGDYLTRSMPEPRQTIFDERTAGFESTRFDLGGISAVIIHVPGHTPGSLMVWIPERKILLSGDNWNPCTWLWFPSSLGAAKWKKHMQRILSLPFDTVLCSHQPAGWKRQCLEEYLNWLTNDVLKNAYPYNTGGSGIRAGSVCWPEKGYEFVFDLDKARL